LQTEPLIYISVEGWLDNAGKTVKSNGGKVLQDRQQIGPHGFRAMIVDSQGNRVTLRSSTA
jgi:predicted enzyme related to lactoylglutathione lyase